MKKMYFLKTFSGILLAFILFAGGNLLAQNRNYLSFDGTDDYVKYVDDATLGLMDGASSYTIEAWVYLPSGAATGGRIVQRYSLFLLYFGTSNNKLSFGVDNGSSFIYYHSNNDALPDDDSWHHVAAIRDASGGTFKLYVDGMNVSSGTWSGYALRNESSRNLYIGQDGGGGNFFQGYIDEVRLKNVAENPLHFHTYDNQYTSDGNTAALFHFNEGTGTNTVNEASSANATLNNGPAWTDWDAASTHLPLAHEWTGASTTDWASTGNWASSTVPATANDVIIPTVSSSNYPLISGDATTPSQCNNLTIESGASVTIPQGKALTVNDTLTNNAGNSDLVIGSNSSGTGSLIVASGTPAATIQRYMTNYTTNSDGWHLLSAPVSNFTISGSNFAPTSGDDDLYEWDESTNTWLNYNGGSFGDSQFQTGKGYLVAYKSAATKEFTGNINTGTFTKNLSYTSTSPHKGLNLLGNPYTSAIDWDLLTKTSNVDGSVYVLRASDGAYISWNGSTGGLTDGIIPAMQGYFVKTTATSESVTMEAADQVHNSTNFYKSGKELAENTFYITVNGNNGESNAYIQFRDDATKTFDHAFDAYKLFGYSTAPQIYTNDGENIYSINCLPDDMQSYSLPVGVKISTSGEYQISFSGIENVSDNFDIKLEDLQTGEQITVNPETTHKFTANEGDDSNRFVLHFYNVTSTPEIGEANNKALIYSYNNNIIVKATDKQLNGKVEIINILGQTMETKSVSNSNILTINTNLNKGVYIVRYSETDDYTQSQKVIIN